MCVKSIVRKLKLRKMLFRQCLIVIVQYLIILRLSALAENIAGKTLHNYVKTSLLKKFIRRKIIICKHVHCKVKHFKSFFALILMIRAYSSWKSNYQYLKILDYFLKSIKKDQSLLIQGENSLIFSSMTLGACGRDWGSSDPLEINPPQRWEQIRCWPTN